MTRETWLLQLADLLRPHFKGAGFSLPSNIAISCGWPTRRAIVPSGKSRTVGQCFSASCSADGRHELFISPAVSDAAQVAAILVHELCHAADDCQHGHGAPFKRIAKAMGLAGKMTATTASPELAERLNALCEKLPAYPHATLDTTIGEKKQGTRMLKVSCPECGYTVRTTAVWLDKGLPVCPCGTEMEEEDS